MRYKRLTHLISSILLKVPKESKFIQIFTKRVHIRRMNSENLQ